MMPEVAELGEDHEEPRSSGPYFSLPRIRCTASAKENEKAIVVLESHFAACAAAIFKHPQLKATELLKLPKDVLPGLAKLVTQHNITSLVAFQSMLDLKMRDITHHQAMERVRRPAPSLNAIYVKQLQSDVARQMDGIAECREGARLTGLTLVLKLRLRPGLLQPFNVRSSTASSGPAQEGNTTVVVAPEQTQPAPANMSNRNAMIKNEATTSSATTGGHANMEANDQEAAALEAPLPSTNTIAYERGQPAIEAPGAETNNNVAESNSTDSAISVLASRRHRRMSSSSSINRSEPPRQRPRLGNTNKSVKTSKKQTNVATTTTNSHADPQLLHLTNITNHPTPLDAEARTNLHHLDHLVQATINASALRTRIASLEHDKATAQAQAHALAQQLEEEKKRKRDAEERKVLEEEKKKKRVAEERKVLEAERQRNGALWRADKLDMDVDYLQGLLVEQRERNHELQQDLNAREQQRKVAMEKIMAEMAKWMEENGE